ncbi:MAG: isopentenyl phosphate kinase family protein [Methanothrix sp.]|nr:isopentenyl phosphate kinase family protein [Methanothrix sp.]OYV10051.1 MAG: amino acid kinase [Methanosaeta sp. ASO1]
MTKILKIGGSILTDKSRELAARPEEIARVAAEIAIRPEDLVLVHGAGSFGHIPAKKYGLPQEFSPEGLRMTHLSVARLCEMVVEALGQAGVDCLPVHPLSAAMLCQGRIESFFLGPVREMIKNGIMPVLHGDVAMDASRGAAIVSGDQLVAYLAGELEADTVAVGSNVDGILVSGRPLTFMSRNDLSQFESDIGASAGVDVTGGMRGKLEELLELADRGTESVIFNAGKKGNITRALKGESVGTRIVRSK